VTIGVRLRIDRCAGLILTALLVVPIGVVGGSEAASALTVVPVSSPTDSAIRAAFAAVNAAGDDAEIDIDVGSATIALTGPVLSYSGGVGGGHALAIHGNGATLRQGGSERVLESTSTGALSVDHLTVTGGQASGTQGDSTSGISARGPLSLADSLISGNSVDGDQSVAVSSGSSVVITDSEVTDNHSRGVGSNGDVSVRDSSISNNFNEGIFAAGSVDISGSTVDHNAGDIGGGGIFAFGSVEVANSTISNNRTAVIGGGIGSVGLSESVTVEDSTIENNTASSGANPILLLPRFTA
jgi:hypothetical protein